MGQQATGFSQIRAIEPSPDDGLQDDAVAVAVARARAQWERDESERLADKQSAWKAEAEKRLAISRIGAQRAEAAMEQMRRQLQKAERDLDILTAQLGQARIDTERERVRWSQSPMIAQAQKAARDLQFERRVKIALRLSRDFAWGVLVVALAVLAASRAGPVATGVWKHETGSQSLTKPLLRQAGIDTDNLPHAVVVSDVAKLRARPTSAALTTASLPRGALVTVIGRRGKWMLVRNAESTEQGWVQLSALENASP